MTNESINKKYTIIMSFIRKNDFKELSMKILYNDEEIQNQKEYFGKFGIYEIKWPEELL